VIHCLLLNQTSSVRWHLGRRGWGSCQMCKIGDINYAIPNPSSSIFIR
jgi:hypothetical protein